MNNKTQTWYELAKADLEFAKSILNNNQRPSYSVNFCHQATEKLLKAVVQSKNIDPKRTHNFKILCSQANIELPEKYNQFLAKLAPHYLASKYPEDIQDLIKTYTANYSAKLLNETKEFFQWLEKNHLLKSK